MIPLTAATATTVETRPRINPWLSSLYAGLATAILAVVFVLAFQAENPVLYIITYLLVGAGPVLGYALARGRLGSSVAPIIGGIVGFIIPILSIILWPILAGALDRTQSSGRLLVGCLLGSILGIAVFLIIASTPWGQDPTMWFAPAIVLALAVWGGTCGAAMAAWAKS
jgi:uncharacterized membrane protein YgaE (UPF0421/DUF939 family)